MAKQWSKGDRRKQNRQPVSVLPELPDSEDELWEYEKFLADYMERVAAPVFLENLDKVYPEFNWQQSEDGTWFSTTVPEDDPDFEPHEVDIYGMIGKEIYDEKGNPIGVDEGYHIVDEIVVCVSTVTAGPFYLCIEWEDENGYHDLEYDDHTSYKNCLSSLRRESEGGQGESSPEYISGCWTVLETLGLAIPDPKTYSASRRGGKKPKAADTTSRRRRKL
ncbi:MAG: hypothetical protein QGH60_10325 [Phycisphaerae bacterium]|jgi:hypothetical protein|nr:hypothetical protein [Phycisphaerae bacterium]